MDTSDILSIVAIFVSSIFATFSFVLGIITYKSNKKLSDLDWLARTQKADIQLSFKTKDVTRTQQVITSGKRDQIEMTHTTYYLVIKNTGNVEAKNINVEFTGEGSESMQAVGAAIGSVNILASGSEISFPFSFYPDGSNSYQMGIWSWENPDGSQKEKKSNIWISS